jgi:hypothetical protein
VFLIAIGDGMRKIVGIARALLKRQLRERGECRSSATWPRVNAMPCVPQGAVALSLVLAALAPELPRSIPGQLRSESFRGKLGTESPAK